MVFLYGKNICFEICQIPLWMTNHLVITNMIRQTFKSKVGKTCVQSKEKCKSKFWTYPFDECKRIFGMMILTVEKQLLLYDDSNKQL